MDGAVDDYLALSLLIQSPKVELTGVIASDGLSTRDGTIKGAQALFGNFWHAVPLSVLGARGPRKGRNLFPAQWRTQAVELFQKPMKVPYRYRRTEILFGTPGAEKFLSAHALLHRMTSGSGELVLMTTGPLTTLAHFIETKPGEIEKFDKIVIMGGAFETQGNIQEPFPDLKFPYSEWNIFCDPYAAQVVFSKKLPIFLIPLDVTRHMRIHMDFLERLEKVEVRNLGEIFRKLLKTQTKGIQEGWYELWDPMTVFAALKPDLFQWKKFGIQVLLEGDQFGRTVKSESSAAFHVAMNVDRERLENLLWRILSED